MCGQVYILSTELYSWHTSQINFLRVKSTEHSTNELVHTTAWKIGKISVSAFKLQQVVDTSVFFHCAVVVFVVVAVFAAAATTNTITLNTTN